MSDGTEDRDAASGSGRRATAADPTAPPPGATPGLDETVLDGEGATRAPARPPGGGPRPPASVGGYPVTGVLGRGGMGVVYRVRDEALERDLAVKVLLAGEHASAEARERFRVEARACAALRHEHVVGVHRFDVDEAGHPFVVMEFVEGESLAERLGRDGPLPPPEAARIGEAVARALEHAHARGVVHRDVKPANVLLRTEDDAPLLTDFGLAKALDRADGLTRSGTSMGTPAYMAPEQAAGEGERIGPRSDVYSLGATLYEALTGQPPFAGGSALQVVQKVLHTPAPAPSRRRPEIDPVLDAVCARCLAKAPEDRYPSAGALAEDLDRYRRGETVDTAAVDPRAVTTELPTPDPDGSPDAEAPASAGPGSTPAAGAVGPAGGGASGASAAASSAAAAASHGAVPAGQRGCAFSLGPAGGAASTLSCSVVVSLVLLLGLPTLYFAGLSGSDRDMAQVETAPPPTETSELPRGFPDAGPGGEADTAPMSTPPAPPAPRPPDRQEPGVPETASGDVLDDLLAGVDAERDAVVELLRLREVTVDDADGRSSRVRRGARRLLADRPRRAAVEQQLEDEGFDVTAACALAGLARLREGAREEALDLLEAARARAAAAEGRERLAEVLAERIEQVRADAVLEATPNEEPEDR